MSFLQQRLPWIVSLVVITALVLICGFIYKRYVARNLNTLCVSNLGKIHGGVQLYLQDYDEVFPTKSFWEAKARTAFSSDGCKAAAPQPNLKPPLPGGGIPGYSYNGILASGQFKLSQARYPGFTIVLRDFATGLPVSHLLYVYAKEADYPTVLEKGWERHSGYGNYLFIDGHVRSLKITSILEPHTESCHTPGNRYTLCAD